MIGALLLSLLPSFFQVPLRRLLGQSIGKKSKIRWGTILRASSVKIGDNVIIGPFCYVKAEQLEIGHNSQIKALSVLSTRLVKLGQYVHIAPLSIISSEFTEQSKIAIGDHSRIFPYCWLDTGEGITIGNNVGVGGHSLIFTHGVWPDYLDGGPVTFGSVDIKDNVWLPWRVFILPNVEIGENSIIGGNSLVNKAIPANTLAAGSPAKIISSDIHSQISAVEKNARLNEILVSFSRYIEFKRKSKTQVTDGKVEFENFKIVVDDAANVGKGDLLILLNSSFEQSKVSSLRAQGVSVLNYKEKAIYLAERKIIWKDFISFIRRYGIRLYIKNN